ncbi:DNA replication factor C complex subunit Rfc1 [Didymosphaeria variabile]|uniref:Replication factor C subunit 1 n=1 Tax=Didymosphaeria variabile TaxID=1932322 RepID=A0A9W9CDE1_9PLEO|nr:DNA replication factor C complex subunit Rfc1 [Didymosphaeria variabile]KAJ4356367.1 DNA replication factor C complex subunit Rfc1 [Didymosphaeria variabile]
MPADIRSFFGGGAQANQGSQKKDEKPAPKKAAPKKPSRASRVVADESDEDDDDVVEAKPMKISPKKPPPKKTKKEPSPELEETTTSEFFASKNKPKRSEPFKKKPAESTPKTTPVKGNGKTSKNSTPVTNNRGPGRPRKRVTAYAAKNDEDEFPDDDLDEADDIFGEDFKSRGKDDDYVEVAASDGDDLPTGLPHRGTPKKPAKKQKTVKDDDDIDPEDEDVDMKDVDAEDGFVEPDEDERATKSMPKKTSTAGKKRKTPELDGEGEHDDEEEEEIKPKRARPKKDTQAKAPAKKKAKKEDAVENKDIQAIYDSIPLVRPPTPPPKDETAKFDWRQKAGGGNADAAPAGGDSGSMPSGSETCLAGLTFVFTGVLQRWGRTEAQELVKRHGGKVTGQPSKNTNYIVLGQDAGPSKLRKIKELNIKTIDEDGLTALIEKLTAAGNQGDSKAQVAFKEKQRKEEEKIKAQAAEMEKEEKARLKALKTAETARNAKTSSADSFSSGKSSEPAVDSRLWTTKYAPSSLNQICGNKATVEKLQRWLQRFPKSLKTNFKLAGPDGSGSFRAVILHGPPGIGKTTAAHLVAKMEGYDIVESNASDTRSKKLVEEGLRGVLSTNSLHGYFAGDGKKVESDKKKMVLIMDEVDGMSAGDRGGVGALAAVCKKTEVPMILICNDRRLPKMKPFDYVTFDLPFRRPTVDQIRSRIMTIAFREGLKMPAPVINALIEGSHADIRQVVNMISTAKLDQEAMDFNKGKQMSKAWQKHVILKPWDITQKILGGGMFAASSNSTLNEKIELYFNDHEFSPLMLQENYLGTNPIQALQYNGPDKKLKLLELASDAADSISDGDLVDRMIHGSQQHWSLMPTHAVFSFVRPASFVAGSTAGHQTRFTTWLGKNSSQGKLTRQVKEIQAHMRLRSSGDRHEVRQQYVPVLWQQLVKRLEDEGKEAVPEIIELMDSYFLTKDDFDAIVELGVGPMVQEKVKIASQDKATFTRLYNQQSHPLPFMKASNVVAPKKASKEKPDLEEAIEESDEEEVVNEIKEEDEDVDISKDKYVKQPKKKAAKKTAATKSRGKKRAAEDDDDGESEEGVKPQGRGKAKGAASKAKKK